MWGKYAGIKIIKEIKGIVHPKILSSFTQVLV